MNNNIINYIFETNRNRKLKEYFLFKKIPIIIKDHFLNSEIDLPKLILKLESILPEYLINYIDIEAIYVGEFKELLEKEVEALFSDGVIYLSNNKDSEESIIEDISHEIGHALEAVFQLDIYGDKKVEREFLGKRIRLYDILSSLGRNDLSRNDFLDVEYSEKIDIYFYKKIGYPLLTSLTTGLFVSPYGATSLREYFSNGFEEYITGDRNYVKRVSPRLYEKIIKLMEIIK